jgi:phosphohistidine phosphatase
VRLYLVQHGEAKSEAEDPDRPLTDRGAAHVREVANGAAAGGRVKGGRIVHSGKTRARQTAEAWGEALGVTVEQSDGLAPKDEPSIWVKRLGDEDLMLVGHLPHLEHLTRELLGADADQPVFRNGELVGLEQDESGRWTVVISPPASDST